MFSARSAREARVINSLPACSLTLVDAFKSNLKRVEWGSKSSLANLDSVDSRMRRSIRSCRNCWWYFDAKDLIAVGSDAMVTEAAIRAI